MRTQVCAWEQMENQRKLSCAWEPIENSMKIQLLRETLKTQGKLRFCGGTYEDLKKTQVLRWNLWNTHGKYSFCVGTYRRFNANTGFAGEPMT